MKDKIRVNRDHFKTERDIISYLFSRTTGLAQQYLFPRYDEDAVDPFLNTNAIFKLLGDHFSNPYEKREAEHSYQRLMMKPDNVYVTFHSRFVDLATRGEISTSRWKMDHYDILLPDLQRAVLHGIQQCATFKEFSDLCVLTSNELSRIKKREQRFKPTLESAEKKAKTAVIFTSSKPKDPIRATPATTLIRTSSAAPK